MRTINADQFSEILEKHSLYLRGLPGGAKANLREANLREANLRAANLCEANLHGANLRRADLRYADLRYADLSYADLSGADLRGANLSAANLRAADLPDADLSEATLPPFQIPQEGTLVVWKKVDDHLVKLRIPEDAARTATPVGRKCRAEYADVLEIIPAAPDGVTTRGMTYRAGERAIPDSYDPDIRIECTHGIHFFLTREEAEGY